MGLAWTLGSASASVTPDLEPEPTETHIERVGMFRFTSDGQPARWIDVRPVLMSRSATQRMLRGQEAGIWAGAVSLGALTGYFVVGGFVAVGLTQDPGALVIPAVGLFLTGPPAVLLGVVGTTRRKRVVRDYNRLDHEDPRRPIIVPDGPGRYTVGGHRVRWRQVKRWMVEHEDAAMALKGKRTWTTLAILNYLVGAPLAGLGSWMAANGDPLGPIVIAFGGVFVLDGVVDTVFAHQAKMRGIDRVNQSIEAGELRIDAPTGMRRTSRVRVAVAPWATPRGTVGLMALARF